MRYTQSSFTLPTYSKPVEPGTCPHTWICLNGKCWYCGEVVPSERDATVSRRESPPAAVRADVSASTGTSGLTGESTPALEDGTLCREAIDRLAEQIHDYVEAESRRGFDALVSAVESSGQTSITLGSAYGMTNLGLIDLSADPMPDE